MGWSLLAQANLALPSPWNYIGLAIASAITLGIASIVWVIYAKLGLRPSHKSEKLPPSEKFPALEERENPLALLQEERKKRGEEKENVELLAAPEKPAEEPEQEDARANA